MKPRAVHWPCFTSAKPVAIIGAGVIGSKVAWACARAGVSTRLYDVDVEQARKARETALRMSSSAEVEMLSATLVAAPTLDAALDGAQLAFENVPERFELKVSALRKIGMALAPDAYMGSNTSSLLCTPLAQASGRPSRFFNMNFSDPRQAPVVELMGGERTSAETRQFARDWARAMQLVVIELQREQMGYCFNRLWRVIKKEALRQADQGIASPQDIDRAWMLGFQTDIGPFGMMDEVGIGTVLAIEEAYHAVSRDPSDEPPTILRRMFDEGALGLASGRGFYFYPDPEFRQTAFLSSSSR